MKKNDKRIEKLCIGITVICLVVLLLTAGHYLVQPSSQPCADATLIIFSNPNAKLAEISSDNFTMLLFTEALKYEPFLNKTGTQVHMGFWSGKGNHGNLVRLLDDMKPTEETPL